MKQISPQVKVLHILIVTMEIEESQIAEFHKQTTAKHSVIHPL